MGAMGTADFVSLIFILLLLEVKSEYQICNKLSGCFSSCEENQAEEAVLPPDFHILAQLKATVIDHCQHAAQA